MAEEIALELEELRHLQSIAKRPRVIALLSSEILNLEKKSRLAGQMQPSEPISVAPKASSDLLLNYTTLGSFGWDQDNEKVKIYVPLEGVDQEKIEVDFKKMSIDLKFHDVGGKNYRCAVPKLNKEIVPEICKVVVKPTKVIITLVKASKETWLDLQFKEDKLKHNLDSGRDPMAGIMDLMKNMYEEGDDEMKRTIAKAWTDSRSGKAADPLKGFQGP